MIRLHIHSKPERIVCHECKNKRIDSCIRGKLDHKEGKSECSYRAEHIMSYQDEDFLVEFAEPLLDEVVRQCFKGDEGQSNQ